ncbi:MAG: amidohydrolase [Caulobacteraceae bacterium]|nr:amidohydrolase [Caulobacteraceae bacterium]
MAAEALRRHPSRFVPTATVDPNRGMEAVREIARLHDAVGLKGVSFAPSFCAPQVPIDDRRAYPIYAKCAELSLPIFVTVGVPGPRIPMAPQRVDLLDEVCWFFPDLTIIMRHGAEPWEDLAVKLMRKWPNLYYSTSAFSPKRYPRAIIDFANRGGREKVMFAGYYSVGLSWERVFADLEGTPFLPEVKPLFLAGNAKRVLGLQDYP